MALVVETGSALANADAYASESFVTTYLGDYGTATQIASWTAALTAERERAIRNATRYIDDVYGPRFKGQAQTDHQALRWPRSYVMTDEGYAIESSTVPILLQRATAELAVRALTASLQPDDSASIRSESKGVGSLYKHTTYVSGRSNQVMFTNVDSLLRQLMKPEMLERS